MLWGGFSLAEIVNLGHKVKLLVVSNTSLASKSSYEQKSRHFIMGEKIFLIYTAKVN